MWSLSDDSCQLYLNSVCQAQTPDCTWTRSVRLRHLTWPEPGLSESCWTLQTWFQASLLAMRKLLTLSLKYFLCIDRVEVEQHMVSMGPHQISKPRPEPRPSQETRLASVNLWTSDLHTFSSSEPSWRGLRCHREGRARGFSCVRWLTVPPSVLSTAL